MQPSSTGGNGLSTPRWRCGLAAVFFAAAISHLTALGNRFALDDGYILANPALRSLRVLPAALASPWWYNNNHLYRPLTLAVFSFERAAFGLAPLPFHAVNVLLHGAVAVLLAMLLTRWVPAIPALAGALLFAIAPVHAEAVASVVGLAELLQALCLLLVMLLVTGETPPSPRHQWAAFLLSAGALAAKEGGVVAPVLVFVAAYSFPPQRSVARRWATASALGTVMMLLTRVSVLGAVGGEIANPVFRVMNVMGRVRIALFVLVRTTWTLLLPVPPSLDYVPSMQTLSDPPLPSMALGAAIVVLVIVLLVRQFKVPSALGVGVWIAASTLAPTSNLLFASGVVASGRTLYSPALGCAFLAAAALAKWKTDWSGWVLRAVLVMYALVALFVTLQECRVWRSTDVVIAAMQQRHPDDYRSYLQLAYMARDRGDDAVSLEYFREVVQRFSGDPEMLTDAATVALRVHDTLTARAWLQHAVVIGPRAARGRTRLVSILITQGDTSGAQALLREGLAADSTQRIWASQLRALSARGRAPQ